MFSFLSRKPKPSLEVKNLKRQQIFNMLMSKSTLVSAQNEDMDELDSTINADSKSVMRRASA